MRNRLLILLGVVGLSSTTIALAQDFDDIYFDSSKKVKKEARTIVKEESAPVVDTSVATQAKNYIEERDVDEYNRRGSYYADNDTSTSYGARSEAADSAYNSESFVYTDRIKRFHNPTVVIESSDPDIVDLYVYTRPSVNIVVGTPTYYSPFGTFAVGYYRPWSWGFYDPWDPFDYWRFTPYYYSYAWHYPHYYHSYWHHAIPHWGHGCVPYYGWSGHSHYNPVRYYGGDRGSRRPVGSSINRGTQTVNRGNVTRTGRIGNVVSNRQGVGGTRGNTTTNRVTRGNVTTIDRQSNGSTSNRGTSTIYRRPSTNNSNVSRETQRSSQRVYNSESSRSYNSGSSFSSGRSSGFSGGSRSSSSNGARGGGHRR